MKREKQRVDRKNVQKHKTRIWNQKRTEIWERNKCTRT